MLLGLLNDRINHKLEKCNFINEHVLNCEPVPLTLLRRIINAFPILLINAKNLSDDLYIRCKLEL